MVLYEEAESVAVTNTASHTQVCWLLRVGVGGMGVIKA